MKSLRSTATLLAALLLCSALVWCLRPASSGRESAVPASAEVCESGGAEAFDPYSALRLHVVANSDSDEDQAAKLAVRDAVLACMRGSIAEAGTERQAEAALLAHGSELLEAARKALAENGGERNVQLILGEFDFPDRKYGGKVYPAGRYRALRVLIGEAAGHNWWCVMFPPLCVIESGERPAEFNEDGTLKFRSAIAEFFGRIFG